VGPLLTPPSCARARRLTDIDDTLTTEGAIPMGGAALAPPCAGRLP
jgi:hypothetical protein